jgi:hypothetical protein
MGQQLECGLAPHCPGIMAKIALETEGEIPLTKKKGAQRLGEALR